VVSLPAASAVPDSGRHSSRTHLTKTNSNLDLRMSSQHQFDNTSGYGGGGGGGDSHADVVSALNTTVNWISRVLQQCQSLRWQVMGYDRLPSGVVDQSRPLYSMANPNTAFDELLAEYSQHVGDSLRTLQSSVTRGGNAHGGQFNVYTNGATSSSTSSSSKRSKIRNNQESISYSDGLTSAPSQQVSFSSSSSMAFPTSSVGGLELATSSADFHGDFSHEPGDWNQLFSDLGETGGTGGRSTENKTFYIVCRQFTYDQVSYGFPAYDMNKAVIGFYREGQDSANQATQIEFVALSDDTSAGSAGSEVVTTVPRAERDRLESQLRSLIQAGSSTVYALPDHMDDLDRMKQDVLVGFWLSEVSMEDLDF